MRPNNWENESYNNIKEDNRPYMDPYGRMMMDEEEFMIGGNDFGNEKKVPHFGFYNNFDDVLADE